MVGRHVYVIAFQIKTTPIPTATTPPKISGHVAIVSVEAPEEINTPPKIMSMIAVIMAPIIE
ncbi:hypothetical protein [Nitrososphaera viennensis]|uniref:Uncharacterized protein n=1 Tax=Nitrososphaera viennensis TaxID=1034015 RepID=A0A977NLI0_9ARCH|nr:hypothetical protein [Nitrososphaera viennensis]UVS68462.1 hypothetical protein NWT39_11190 [Nitrososphaera viennensis]